ncbi:TPA: hypothetical protein ROA69_000675 [Escherichia coli]|uniref:hypothetical protein n=1 Tax=Escherichia TaxID=561 RepID=UPI0002C8AB20|nr:hypothetical protein [Escherichia coli]EFA4296482.1 hypothetical protein [Escherichia coli O18:H7]EFK4098800.1 hypothetical protein [Escherichia coli]EIA1384737.1 hypothetical protein [Escherichia coli]ELV1711438.1 hypothetical protein [Escherichia coli]ELX8425412.1 hypothetical protein [Escherichia coli]
MQLKPTNQKLNVTHVDFETFAALIRSEPQKVSTSTSTRVYDVKSTSGGKAIGIASGDDYLVIDLI